MKNSLKNTLWIEKLFCILFVCVCYFSAATAFAHEKIFILHSYHQEYPWTSNENKGFTDTVAKTYSASDITISTEYLDTKRVKLSKDYQLFFFKYLKQKFAHFSPDVIFCTDDNALTFLLKFKEKLFGEAPVVFCGVNNLEVEQQLNKKQYSGIFEKKEVSPNLTFLKQFLPKPDNIILLGDNSFTHQAIVHQIKADLASYFPNQKYTIIADKNLPYLTRQLQVHKTGVVFLTSIGGLEDEHDDTIPLQKSINSIVETGNFTIISMEDVYLEKGVLGGYVTSGYSQGKEAANRAVHILKGKSLSSVPLVNNSTNEYMFNYPQLKKLGIAVSKLPPESIVLNKPQSFYDHYKHWIWIVLCFCALQTLIIAVLIKNIKKRKNAEVALQSSRDDLEEKVLERTHELIIANSHLENEIVERKQIEIELKESEVRFKALHDASFGGVVIHDKGLILDCNQGLSDITGFTHEELVGMNGLELIAPNWLDLVLKNIKNGYEKSYEVEGVRKDGSIYPLAIRGKNVPYKGREVRVIEFRDITESKLAEDALSTSEKRFQDLTENSTDWIWEFDENEIFTYASPRIEDLLGYTPEEIVGQSAFDPMSSPEGKQVLKEFTVFKNARKTFSCLMNVNRHKDGRKVILESSGVPIFDKAGVFRGYRGIDRDVTERVNFEQQLRQAHKMEAIGTLAGGIAHDFNNILTAVIGYAELAQIDLPESSSNKEYIDEVLKASNRAKELVKHILSFSRKEASKAVSVNVSLIAKEALKLLRASIPTTIDITKHIAQECGYVFANPTQIHQIFMNLCTNASQAMAENEGILTVTASQIKISEDALASAPEKSELRPGSYIKITISDTGPGIPPQVLNRIFDPYFTTKDIGKGSGMGLAVSHGIIKSLNGAIEVESEVDHGTSFHVYLPIHDQAKIQESTIQEDDVEVRGTEHILVIDDEKTLVVMNEQRLNQLGYTVTTSTKSTEALKLFNSQPDSFDLVITDQTMPKMTGSVLAQKLLEIRPNIPIILCTGYSASVDEAQSREIGISAFVMKPIEFNLLARTIRQVLDAH